MNVEEPPYIYVFEDPVIEDGFQRGFAAGLHRVENSGAEFAIEPVIAATEAAGVATVFQRTHAEQPLSVHAVELLAELVSVAITVRVAHGEAGLEQSDFEAFMPAAMFFFNTFVGCPDPS